MRVDETGQRDTARAIDDGRIACFDARRDVKDLSVPDEDVAARKITDLLIEAQDVRAADQGWADERSPSAVVRIRILNDLFYDRAYRTTGRVVNFVFCLMKNPLLYRSARPESDREAREVSCGAARVRRKRASRIEQHVIDKGMKT